MSDTPKYVIGQIVGDVHYKTVRLRPRPRPLSSPVTAPQWFVVAVAPQQEENVRDDLELLGYRIVLPMMTFWQRIPRHRLTVTGPRKRLASRPLFPGYLFLGKDEGHPFDPAKLTKGVVSILATRGQYLRIPDRAMAELLDRDGKGPDYFKEQEAARFLKMIGQEIAIPDGPFAGFVAVIRRASAKGIESEIEAGGKRIRLSLRLEEIEPA